MNPRFLHPPDFNVVLCSFKLIGTKNYQLWSRVVIAQLLVNNKLAFIDGTCTRDSVPLEHQSCWDRYNVVVGTWLINSVSPDFVSGDLYIPITFQIWKDLKERFEIVNGTREFQLHREICTIHQGTLSISTYFTKLRRLWDEFSTVFCASKCNCGGLEYFNQMCEQLKLFNS